MTVVKVLRHGQITLPKNLREELDIKEGDILEIELEQSCLVLKAKMLVDKDKLTGQGGQEPVLPMLRAGGLQGGPRSGAAAEQGEGAP